ncbi:MAG TPA: hypothetical protein VL793_16960 [Patescibacteria group bacterium]|nr:hypothetical protein [Patescibacteria group bacterium]
MNGSLASDVPPVPTIPQFKDRRAGLIMFGILEITFGVLAALMIPLIILGQAMAAHVNQEPTPVRQLIPAMLTYIVLSIVLISVGIGSIKARRWARALSLVLGWSWLLVGFLSVVMMTFVFPDVIKNSQPRGQQVPPAAVLIGLLFALAFMSIFLVAVPGALVLFYRSRHVNATCQTRNPSPSWTDACPLPVLALTLWIGLGALGALSMPVSTHGVIPVFGKILSGVAGSLCCVALALLWGYCAWMLYRLQSTAWWVTLITLCVVTISAAVTFSQISLPDLYQAMGYSEHQIDAIKQFSFFQGNRMVYWSMACLLPMLGFLLYVKRYFRSSVS